MKNFLMAILLTVSAAWSVTRTNDDNLTRELAKFRKEQVKTVEYFLNFELEKGKDTFKGSARLEIELNHLQSPLSIDFLIRKIESVKVNGSVLSKYPERRGSFDIPVKNLAQKMSVEVLFTGEYSREPSGLQKSIDPQDGSEYLFTDFEPSYAHKLFPCFDQPDLKGIFHVTVTAPADWKVIHNELIQKEETVLEKKLTTFRATKPISTYLFFLGAGPYVEWKDNYGDLPLFLYARKSLEKHVDAGNIMETTKKGLKFFNEYFDYPYPFSKYAHVFIPEFAWGGMENPGAVTLNERNIFRGPVPQARYERRNSLILHEMAHMWFGDLVTMEWWNDLWLNESFASYVATVAQEKALDSDSAWLYFFAGKTWGYWQDQLITTHPIETEVPDVRTAKGNFDGITYAKGAASLKQLHFFVGEEAFRSGLRAYFKRFAYSNTKRQDFIGAIALAAKTDLTAWTTSWLQTAGPNYVRVIPECKDGDLTKLSIEQKPSVSGNLSTHRTKLALYELDDDELELDVKKDAIFSTELTEVPELKGEDCPDFIFPNHDDVDYAVYSFDDRSLEKTKIAIKTLPDPLSRLMIWNTLYHMMRNSELSPTLYFRMAMEALQTEKDEHVLGTVLGRYQLRMAFYLYLDKEERANLAPEFEAVILKRIEEAAKGSSIQMSFFDFFTGMAQTQMSVTKLFNMLIQNKPPEGIKLDRDRRWAIISNLAQNGHTEALKLIEEEKKRDPSVMGKRMALAATASFPDKDSKARMWKNLFTNKELTFSDLMEAGGRIHLGNYPELSGPFLKDFFQKLITLDWKKNDDKVDFYFESLFPLVVCSEEVRKMSQEYFDRAKNLSSLARRSWSEAQDELNRCVKVRKLLPLKTDLQ